MADTDTPQPPPEPSLGGRLLARAALVHPGEGRAVAWAALFFFALMSGYFALRPLRDSFGIEGGVENLPWLFTGTLVGTLVASPVFSILVSRWPRRRFLPFVYRFSAANLLVFLLLYQTLPPAQLVHVGRAFYVWLSVFNLFAISVLGGFLADLFTTEQGKRLFGLIGVGGTLGALAGSELASRLTGLVSPEELPVVLYGIAVGLLEVSARCVHALGRCAPPRPRESPGAASEAIIGGNMLDGIRHVLRSPFLQMICAYLFMQTFVSTVLYFQQAGIVAQAFPDRVGDRGARTEFLADVGFWTQALTLILQLFFSGRILRRLGLGLTLAALPLVALGSLGALAFLPTLTVIALAQVLTRGANFATAKPAREALYTLVSREERYKSKSFIDTFVYRGGDALGAWMFNGVKALGLTVASVSWVAMPVGAMWSLVGLTLGRRSEALRIEAARGGSQPAARLDSGESVAP